MMNRFRYLPPAFWIGLFPVVVLLWAWADSLGNYTTWSHCRDWRQGQSLSLHRSELVFSRTKASEEPTEAPGQLATWGPMGGRTGAFGWIRRRPVIRRSPMGDAWFPAPRAEAISDRSWTVEFATRHWVVPLWLILLAYAPLWLGVASEQARRRRRKLAAELPEPAPAT